MPTNRIARSTAIATSVRAAFFDSGGLKAGTPVAMASVPVSATAPDANARRSSRIADGAGRGRSLAATIVGRRTAFAEDEDPVHADADHEQRASHEQVGRDREDVARLAQAAQVADGDQGDRADADRGRRTGSSAGKAEMICSTADEVETATVRM